MRTTLIQSNSKHSYLLYKTHRQYLGNSALPWIKFDGELYNLLCILIPRYPDGRRPICFLAKSVRTLTDFSCALLLVIGPENQIIQGCIKNDCCRQLHNFIVVTGDGKLLLVARMRQPGNRKLNLIYCHAM